MPPSIEEGGVEQKIAGIRLTDRNLRISLALGIRDRPTLGKTNWLSVDIANGQARTRGGWVALDSSLPAAHESLGVAVAVSASLDIWDRIERDGEAALVNAAQAEALYVTGDLALFIRFMLPIVEIWSARAAG